MSTTPGSTEHRARRTAALGSTIAVLRTKKVGCRMRQAGVWGVAAKPGSLGPGLRGPEAEGPVEVQMPLGGLTSLPAQP